MNTTTTTQAPASRKPLLSSQEVAAYRQEGYVIYDRPVFAPAKFQGLRDCFESILDGLSSEIRPEAMDVPHFVYPELLKWVLADEVLDLVEPIIGPDIALFSTHFICKPPGTGKRVPWHEDSAYWKGKVEPLDVCTVWLAIDPSTRANGCMKVIPRTHETGRRGYSDYGDVDTTRNVFGSEILAEQRDDSRAVHLELQANQASLHDARIMHGSDANTSNLRRCGYTMRFMPTTCKLNPAVADVQNIYLGRGKDRAGNVYADPTKSYPEIARFRSTKIKNSH